jgi:hypothetical protein
MRFCVDRSFNGMRCTPGGSGMQIRPVDCARIGVWARTPLTICRARPPTFTVVRLRAIAILLRLDIYVGGATHRSTQARHWAFAWRHGAMRHHAAAAHARTTLSTRSSWSSWSVSPNTRRSRARA